MNLEDYLPDAQAGEKLISAAIEEHGIDEGIRQVPPLAFTAQTVDGIQLDDPDSFLLPTVEIAPTINPLFHALMLNLGAKPNGLRTYEFSVGAEKTKEAMADKVMRLQALLEVLPGGICYTNAYSEDGERDGFESYNIRRYAVFYDLFYGIRETKAGEKIDRKAINHMTADHPTSGPLAGAAIVLSVAKGRLYIKVCTNKIGGKGLLLSEEPGTPDLDRLRPSGRLDSVLVTPDRAVSLLEAAAAEGYTVVDPEGQLGLLRRVLADLVIAQRVPGSPGLGRLVVGNSVKQKLGKADGLLGEYDADRATRSALIPAALAGEAVATAKKAGAVAAIDCQVEDVIRMSQSTPVATEPKSEELRLRDYQREAVGLHLATEVGFLQCCSVGLGKTAITLRGMRAWADKKAQEQG